MAINRLALALLAAGATLAPSVALAAPLKVKLVCKYDNGSDLIVRVDQAANRMTRVYRWQGGNWMVEFDGPIGKFGGRITPEELVIADSTSSWRSINRRTLILRERSRGSMPVSTTGRCVTAPWDGIAPRLPARKF